MDIEKIIEQYKLNKAGYEKWNKIYDECGKNSGKLSQQDEKLLEQWQNLEFSGCSSYDTAGRYAELKKRELVGYKRSDLKEKSILADKEYKIAFDKMNYYDKKSIVDLFHYQSQLVILPGDETKFEEMEGYPVKIVNLGAPQKGVVILEDEDEESFEDRCWDRSSQPILQNEMLLKHKVVGLINAKRSYNEEFEGIEYYGLPVEKDYKKMREK